MPLPVLSMSRYLTPEDKTKILDFWMLVRKEHSDTVDQEIVPLCDFVNAYSDICTIGSCVGHAKAHKENGHLWIWNTVFM